MNKKRIQKWLEVADVVLKTCEIEQDGNIQSAFRSQLSTFCAAAAMGSLKSVAAFFVKQGNAVVPRERLLSAMYCLVSDEYEKCVAPETVFRYICSHNDPATKESFLDAAVTLKMAMNLFDLGKGVVNDEKSESSVQ